MKGLNSHARIFKMYANESQLVDSSDIKVMLRCLGYVLSEKQDIPEKLFTLEEFSKFIEEIENKEYNKLIESKESILNVFKQLDTEDRGYVNAIELKKLLLENCKEMNEDEIVDFFTLFPPNSKGELCYKVLIEKLYAQQ
ncbi:MYL2 [Ecytonucleospora hepatopenaei]|uniref:MYL2 n=1 Tax=Ecytonucleospora hepatopenaei TaxID=646526 RepID=A0A1W0E4N3_9MICR|nr:MYL2 [Ecytonucleospora hepatopenaei]